ncbi:MAG: hypothetical protein GXP62_02035 [Oligoflexia bacterium]|nr:hypothetical protein [Oligoflexia bacterium]
MLLPDTPHRPATSARRALVCATGATSMPVGALLVLLGGLSAGCGNDKSLGVLHEPPAVTITSPSEGASFFQGESVRFEALAQVFDETALSDLTHSWVTGTQSMCSTASVTSDGAATCDWVFSDVGEQTVTVTVTDTRLDTANATLTVNILENTPPSITLNSPVTGDFFEPEELIVFQATVSDAEDTPENLTVSVISSLDGDLGLDAAPSSSGAWTAAGNLSNGDHLITVSVTDSAGRTDQDTATVSVNARPGAPTVAISPNPAASGDSLVAIITSDASDPEGDAVTYRYDWWLGGALYQTGNNDAISSGVTVRAQYWEVYAYPSDGFGYGDPGYASVTIDNSAPAVDSVTIDPSSPVTTDTLTAMPSGWNDQDSDPEQYRYQWTLNGTIDTGETTSTFPDSKTVKGDRVQVQLTPYDDYDDGSPVTSTTIAIQNSPPTSPGIAISPSAPEPEDDLYCEIVTDSTDADGDRVTYRYEWYLDGTLTSETTNTVDSSLTAHGDGWECVVTPSDGEDDGTSVSDYVTVNDGTAPVAPEVNDPLAYRNGTSVTLTGTCEADCTLTFYCGDSLTSWSDTGTCATDGTFSWISSLSRGETSSCYATCTDLAGNTSPNSNTVSTEVCDPFDIYEDSAGYGDSGPNAISEWSSLPDDGLDTISISGNMLEGDDADWYLVSASDDVSQDISEGIDYFNFDVKFISGSSTYEFYVYEGTYDSTARECSTSANEYSWFNQDVGEDVHAVPSETRSCGSSSADYNDCADDSTDFYIEVVRKSSVSMSCDGYELEITNGVW